MDLQLFTKIKLGLSELVPRITPENKEKFMEVLGLIEKAELEAHSINFQLEALKP